MELKNYFTQDASGNIIQGATCFLYNSGSQIPATGVTDITGAPLANPFTSDSTGLVQFRAPNGEYDLRITSGLRGYTIRVQCLDVTDTITTVNQIIEDGQNSAEAYAVDILVHATEVNTNRILAQQAVLDTQGKVEEYKTQLTAPDSTNEIGYRSSTVFNALTWVMTPSQFKVVGDVDDTNSFKRMFTAATTTSGVQPVVILSGTYTIVGGFDPTQYEWANITWVSHNATINASSLTGDNGVVQVGTGFTQLGHLNINITNTTAGGNGFVRTGMTVGRWWNAAQRVEQFNIESIKVTTATGVTCVAVSGSAKRGKIGRVGCFGSFAIGFLTHWSGLPNDISPVTTYHPHSIVVDEVYGDAATESLVTLSAAGGVTVRRISGDSNAKNFMCIAGDWGAKYATPSEINLVGRSIEVSEFACSATQLIGAHIIGQPGLVAGNTLAMDVKLGTGRMSGAVASTVGILHSNVDGGIVNDVEITGFTNGISPGAFVYNVIFRNTRTNDNRGNGIRVSGTADVRKGLVFDHIVAKNNNTAAAGGVSQIEIGSTADGLHFINPKLASNNTASHGIHFIGTAKNCIVDSPVGEGFSGSRYVVFNEASTDNNNIVYNIQSDTANLLTPSATPILVRVDAIGRRIFAAEAIPTVGTFAVGDKVEFNRPSTLGFEGATCTVSGTPGTWKTYGAVTP